jgi:hypothetical protein
MYDAGSCITLVVVTLNIANLDNVYIAYLLVISKDRQTQNFR